MQISWFPKETIEPPGKLGLTNLPGARERSSDEDLDNLRDKGVKRILCLVEPHELKYVTPAETVEQRRQSIEQRGMQFMHHPVVDFDTPTMLEMNRIIASIHTALVNGETVIVHCWAGLGRAGTIAACLLIHRGMHADYAIQSVRSARPGAIQSARQERFIERYISGLSFVNSRERKAQ